MIHQQWETISEGYLYSPWNGVLKEYRGEVIHMRGYVSAQHIVPEKTYFVIKDEHTRIMKKMICSPIEGEVVNKVLWLEESNIRKAAQIFIEYEETQISKLKMMIENHEILIKTFKKEAGL